jgi:flagellar hook-basal body complex protein FliE
MATPAAAASAYSALAKIADRATGVGGVNAAEKGDTSFGSMLRDALGSVAESGRKSDAQMQAMAAGKANLVDVVTAVSETEVAMQTLVSVRDRVIQSYEDIMRMPI